MREKKWVTNTHTHTLLKANGYVGLTRWVGANRTEILVREIVLTDPNALPVLPTQALVTLQVT